LEICPRKPRSLAPARGLLAQPNAFRLIVQPVAGQFLVIDARLLDALRVSIRSSSGPLMRF
jgi:hypothetical protein